MSEKKKAAKSHDPRATRETIESIVIAIILALLFRTFEAEAFVIPTGSMAPTLMGRHHDVECPQCGYRYRVGATIEDEPNPHEVGRVAATICPLCRYTNQLDYSDPNQRSFSGDRILVSKLTDEPDRWDIIVFKFPGNAKQNYIKRLIGLPGERVRIFGGDIYVKGEGDGGETIARKPPHKELAMLQLVDDTNHIPRDLLSAGHPSRWQPWSPGEENGELAPMRSVAEQPFVLDARGGQPQWLHYRHLPRRDPRLADALADVDYRGMLVTDFVAYNFPYTLRTQELQYESPTPRADLSKSQWGRHWVGDLALEAKVEVESESGEVLLTLIEGGAPYQARIDVATGAATLGIDDGLQPFNTSEGAQPALPQAETAMKGPGAYNVRFSNIDNQLRLWIDDELVEFSHPTTYKPAGPVRPEWSPEDPGDLAPARIGADDAKIGVSRLRVLRDIYYLAVNPNGNQENDYQGPVSDDSLVRLFASPERWAESDVFEWRREATFHLGQDQYFPMGDNSAQSFDARMWPPGSVGNFVEGRMLTGEAMLIYWPHPWRRPIPFLPHFERMGLIR